MNKNRTIIPYTSASLDKLDAGSIIAYPRNNRGGQRYYAVPSFLIIGAAKCGTREMLIWLNQHPNLRAMPKEVNFFDEVLDIEKEWPRYVLNPHFLLSKDREHCLASNLHTFEKTPAYFNRNNQGGDVPELIKKMMPSGKFIVLLRNPVDRAYSAFQMGKRRQPVRAPRIPEELTFDDYVKHFTDASRSNSHVLTTGHYAKHFKRWFKYFARNQLFIIIMETFKKSPFTIMEQLQYFLEIPVFDYVTIAEKGPRDFWVIKGEPSKAYQPLYPPMSSQARQLLNDYYAPHNQELKSMFPEIDFPW